MRISRHTRAPATGFRGRQSPRFGFGVVRASIVAAALGAVATGVTACGSGSAAGPHATTTTSTPYEAVSYYPSYFGVAVQGAAHDNQSYLRWWGGTAAGATGSLEVGKSSEILHSGLGAVTYDVAVSFGPHSLTLHISGHGIDETASGRIDSQGVFVDFPAVSGGSPVSIQFFAVTQHGHRSY